MARGLHPAVLSGHGLGVALESLAARAPVPVALPCARRSAARSRSRSPPTTWSGEPRQRRQARAGHVERASRSSARRRRLVVEVVDDGVGGADTESRGTGLRGLADRVEALGGRLRVWTPAGRRDARTSGDPMRVVIAEDSVLFREGLRASCRRGRVRGRRRRASTADELLRKMPSQLPDIAIVDIRLPPTHSDEGLQAALEIRANSSRRSACSCSPSTSSSGWR